MSFFNAILRSLIDLTLLPLRSLPEWLSLSVFSLVLAVIALLVYKKLSDQTAIETIKRKIAASIFEIRLFNDDLRAILRAQLDLLALNARYMALNLVPLVVMVVLMLPLFAQLQFVYGYSGLQVGKPAVLALRLDDQATGAERPQARLDAPDGVRVDTGSLWIPERRELAWRVVGETPGSYELAIDIDGRETTKNVVVSDAVARRSPIRQRPGFFSQLLYPAEDPLPNQLPIEAITLDYPEHDVSLLGFEMHWSIALLILSLVFALLMRKRFGVTF